MAMLEDSPRDALEIERVRARTMVARAGLARAIAAYRAPSSKPPHSFKLGRSGAILAREAQSYVDFYSIVREETSV